MFGDCAFCASLLFWLRGHTKIYHEYCTCTQNMLEVSSDTKKSSTRNIITISSVPSQENMSLENTPRNPVGSGEVYKAAEK